MRRMTDDMLNMGIVESMEAMRTGTIGAGGSIEAAGGGYNQTVNIYSPQALTPSEVARQTRNATRSMVLALRGV